MMPSKSEIGFSCSIAPEKTIYCRHYTSPVLLTLRQSEPILRRKGCFWITSRLTSNVPDNFLNVKRIYLDVVPELFASLLELIQVVVCYAYFRCIGLLVVVDTGLICTESNGRNHLFATDRV